MCVCQRQVCRGGHVGVGPHSVVRVPPGAAGTGGKLAKPNGIFMPRTPPVCHVQLWTALRQISFLPPPPRFFVRIPFPVLVWQESATLDAVASRVISLLKKTPDASGACTPGGALPCRP